MRLASSIWQPRGRHAVEEAGRRVFRISLKGRLQGFGEVHKHSFIQGRKAFGLLQAAQHVRILAFDDLCSDQGYLAQQWPPCVAISLCSLASKNAGAVVFEEAALYVSCAGWKNRAQPHLSHRCVWLILLPFFFVTRWHSVWVCRVFLHVNRRPYQQPLRLSHRETSKMRDMHR